MGNDSNGGGTNLFRAHTQHGKKCLRLEPRGAGLPPGRPLLRRLVCAGWDNVAGRRGRRPIRLWAQDLRAEGPHGSSHCRSTPAYRLLG